MGLIKLNIKTHAPMDLVYELAHQPFDFLDALPHIRNIRKLEENREHTYSKTEWVLDLPLPKILGEISWIKDARWNDADHRCDISLNPESRGIVKKIVGLWKFTPRPDGTDMNMSVDLTVRHFLIGPSTNSMIDKLLKHNLESLMIAIGNEAEKRAAARSKQPLRAARTL